MPGEAALEIVTNSGSAPIGTMHLDAVAPALFLAPDYSLTLVAFLEQISARQLAHLATAVRMLSSQFLRSGEH